jgi:hypothetical protein
MKRVWRASAASVLLLGLCGCTNADWNQVARLWEPRSDNAQAEYGASGGTSATASSTSTPTGTNQDASVDASTGSAAAMGFCHQAAANEAQHATQNGFTPQTVERLRRQQLAQCQALMAQ